MSSYRGGSGDGGGCRTSAGQCRWSVASLTGSFLGSDFGFGSRNPARLSSLFLACWNGRGRLCSICIFSSSSLTEPSLSFYFPQGAVLTLVPRQIPSNQCMTFPWWATTQDGPIRLRGGFLFFWLRWVFAAVRGLSLVAVSGCYSSLLCAGFSLQWLLLLWSTGSRRVGFSSCGSWALEHRLSQ